jgi:glycosyltransferase involved in cell wall biosynthesis
MSHQELISVVIATLGGEFLESTLQSLNQGSVRPAEILVCIPVAEAEKVAHLERDNVRVLKTNFRGQVAQRRFGFENARHDVVMQLDDDMLLDETCMESLLDTLRASGPKIAVAPALQDKKTGNSVYAKPTRNRVLLAFYYWLMNGADGYAPGKVDKSGSAVGVDPAKSDAELHDVDWLAGGCILHYRNNLILENFWPLAGKAYYEDIVHSYLLRGKGIRLVVDVKAKCSLDTFSQASFKPSEFIKNLYRDYLARKYWMNRFGCESPRIYLYYFMRGLSYLYWRIRG